MKREGGGKKPDRVRMGYVSEENPDGFKMRIPRERGIEDQGVMPASGDVADGA